MTSWSEGYVSDVAYSIGYYREMSPAHLAFAAASIGKDPGGAWQPKRVLELGFGMGVGFVLGAASQPETFFEGCDFNPEHVAHAQRLAADAGVANVSIREASFQDLASEARDGQHDLDLIQLHGILTWVSTDAHRAIVEIARKRLRPGGLLYVSYNCMPGWAQMMPVQRLMREHAKLQPGGSLARTTSAVATVSAMMTGKAKFFAINQTIQPRLDKMKTMQPSYLAHEYLNENWHIFHFADVAEMMSGAKLNFLGSATLAENIDAVSVPPEMHQMVTTATDPVWKETIRDFAGNKQFRRDIYARGLRSMNNAETLALIESMQFTLAVPRASVKLKLNTPLGEVDAKPEIYNALADVLADGILSFSEIEAAPALKDVGRQSLLQALALFVHSLQVFPIIAGANDNVSEAQRFNRTIAERANQGRFYNFLATPVVRGGLPASTIDLLLLDAVLSGTPSEANRLEPHLKAALKRLGVQLQKDGKAVTEMAETEAMVKTETNAFLQQKLPLWKRLGVL
jgi:predicted O-methyltransferase YrrM